MKLDSKYFDRIRLRPDPQAAEKSRAPSCGWEGCEEPGLHKAPRGRDHEGEYYHFCVDHVRLYNKSYNYFSGLNDRDIQAYLKDSLTGHRPTWKMGSASSEPLKSEARSGRRFTGRARDPFELFEGTEPAPAPVRRKVRSLEAKALETLDLPQESTGETIRARYKSLVKQYHPDVNGGDRGSEDRLREVIQAYKLLKQSGFC
ncbi:J domain-containing protein [Mangrovibrevibacter kandeliae]|uniref:J domain-containing protein n=1 Tax=Mangrovibrevibacter kandeliae TaxID=2968473 RepID=UPI0021185AA6|nr:MULTISPECIES: J domain-containing protein [unclassified Aurantimonas]MCQ8783873.1 J domain-containing protein [Aurantimonas sp. CSK15Z-1]MCW4116592.1 J domain-containing protein [Aurantimonas sp. MSK8Z-1]